jgi:RHS repeat-associated protein
MAFLTFLLLAAMENFPGEIQHFGLATDSPAELADGKDNLQGCFQNGQILAGRESIVETTLASTAYFGNEISFMAIPVAGELFYHTGNSFDIFYLPTEAPPIAREKSKFLSALANNITEDSLIKKLVEDRLIPEIYQLFSSDNWLGSAKIAFGENANLDLLQTLANELGKNFPAVRIVDRPQLQDADGAWVAEKETIYISRDLLGNPDRLTAVLIEEIGHYFDSRVNSADTPGDEGEIFSRLVRGESIAAGELVAMQAEDDSLVFTWGDSTYLAERSTSAPFAIKAGGIVEINNNGDFDGNPLDLSDDARIYAAKGFKVGSNTILPVARLANGNPVRDANGKLVLVDRAIAVAAGYNYLSVPNNTDYANLTPPQIVAAETIVLPDYNTVKANTLAAVIPANTPTQLLDSRNGNLERLSNWNTYFGVNATGSGNPGMKVIRVTQGDFNIPTNAKLKNAVIIVEKGDIDFLGSGQQFENVILVTEQKDILLGQVNGKNLKILSAREIHTKNNAKFSEKTLITNQQGDISFRGETVNNDDNVDLVIRGEIDLRSTNPLRANILSSGDIVSNSNVTIYGTIVSQKSIFFKGNATVFAIPAADTTPPTVSIGLVNDSGSSSTDRLTNSPDLTGQVVDTSSISQLEVSVNANFTSAVDFRSSIQSNGQFTLTRTELSQVNGGSLPDGSYTIYLRAKDSAGNVSNPVNINFQLDTIAAIPQNLQLVNDSGFSSGDRVTKFNQPVIAGTGIAGDKIELFNGTSLLGTATVGSNGNWQVTSSTLADGNYQLVAVAKDAAGNVSANSPGLSVTIDTQQPVLSLTDNLANALLDNNARFRGSINGSGSNIVSLSYQFDGQIAKNIVPNSQGIFDELFDFSSLANGANNLTIVALDAAGNQFSQVYSVVVAVDKNAPIIIPGLLVDSGVSNSDSITNNPAVSGTISDASQVVEFTVEIDNLPPANILDLRQTNGQFTLDRNRLNTIYGNTLPDGDRKLTFRAKDIYGNTTAAVELSFTLDTAANIPTNLTLQPASDTGVSSTDRLTQDNTPTILGSGEAGNTVKLFDGTTLVGETTVDNSGNWQITISPLTPIADGSHSLAATTIDRAGNTSNLSSNLDLLVDTTSPTIQFARDLTGSVLNGTSRLQGEFADANLTTVRYQFDGAAAMEIPANNGRFDSAFDYTGINDGAHDLTVTVTDAAGNVTSRTFEVTVARGDLLTIALLNDTGSSNSDGITSDINIHGQVADRKQISRLEFSLDGDANYADLTAALQLDGTFRLLPAQLDSLAGGKLSFGVHSLQVRGVLADGTLVATASVNFVYQAENRHPSLALASGSDTGVKGDLVTSNGTVDLVAKTAAGSSVSLGNLTTIADANGIATFSGIALTAGVNNFTLTASLNGETTTTQTQITRVDGDDVILTWNRVALEAIRREAVSPPAAARILAMVHAAMYDAVNAITQKYAVYRVDAGNLAANASEIAAAAAAAAKILNTIYPNQQAYINATLDGSLSAAGNDSAKTAGIALGESVAANILAWRQTDGSRTTIAYNPSTEAGKWQPDLPNFGGALLPQWGSVKTFALQTGSQFRPNGAPSLTSAEYTAAFNEVKNYGAINSSSRSSEQTEVALFWADGSGTYTPSGHWNEIAATAASMAGKNLLENARVFAQLNLALADAGIAAWDAKYTYNTWRPITAIRQADKDGNENTTADANWLPLVNTPPFPEYISGHSTFSSAAATILTRAFGDNFSFYTSTTGLPEVSRHFASFQQAALEAGESRIYGGIHFQFANRDGQTLGKQIGDYVADRFLTDSTNSPLQVNLSVDTAAFGTTNRDRLTSNPEIVGKVTLPAGNNWQLQVASDGGQFVNISETVDASGNFSLTAAKLANIVGSLTDKTYQLQFRLVDGNNQIISTNNFNFTLDRTALTISLDPLTGEVTPTAHLTGQTTDLGGSNSGKFRVDGGNWIDFTTDATNKFDKVIKPQGLTIGRHIVELQVADLAGNITEKSIEINVNSNNNIYASTAAEPGWGSISADGFTLIEGGSLIVQNSIDLTLGGTGKRTVELDLKTSFDKTDTKSFVKDRVVVYLVDNNNNLLPIDSQNPAGIPLFTLSEAGAEIIPGLVKFDGDRLQIDVSNVAATRGKLVVQLLNLDNDRRTQVKVANFSNILDPQGTPGNSIPTGNNIVTPGGSITFDGYLATNNAQLLLRNVTMERTTGKYTAELRVQNVGNTTLSRHLTVLLANLPAGVSINNPSGNHPTGSTYLNFDTAIPVGGLAAGGISDAIKVEINDPSLTPFSFKPIVLQGAMDAPPDLSALANLSVKVGEKLDIPLTGMGSLSIQSNGNLPTGEITGNNHLVFKPSPTQIGSYSFTLVAKNGSLETRQNVVLNVIADAVSTTRVSGIIAETNQAGLANVLVELGGYQAVTDSNGKFTITLPDGVAGDTLKIYGQRIQGGTVTYPFIAEKMNLLLGHEVYSGVNNQLDRPIYLPKIDVSTGTTVNPNGTTVVTNPNLTGAKVTVAANSLFDKNGTPFSGILSITEVPPSLTPAALPENLHTDLVVTVQPGDMVFNTPAQITLPNRAGYLPGAELDLWSINPNTGLFDIVGKGRVSTDGSKVETISGGIRNSSWHFFAPPPPPARIFLNPANNYEYEKDCGELCENKLSFKSEVSTHTGHVSDDLSVLGYTSQGSLKTIDLHYDSSRAYATKIFRFNGTIDNSIFGRDIMTAKVSVIANGIKQTLPGLNSNIATGLNGGERIWQIDSNGVNTGIQGDLTSFKSGVYATEIEVGIRGVRVDSTTGESQVFGTTAMQEDRAIVVNDSDSVFGAGWNLSGLQRLVISEDSSALLIDGNGKQWLFAASSSNIYASPDGDFSQLEKLATGGWQRTTKDGTRYMFDSRGLMTTAIDRYDNTTQHIYNLAGNIKQIIDPVGLTTTFNYIGNRVSSIVDPAGRTVRLSYDSRGNLVSVIEPGSAETKYNYDDRHLQTATIDKGGQTKTGTYDEFGRAKTATREDGTIFEISPIEVRGLLGLSTSINVVNPIVAENLPDIARANTVDGNGQTAQSILNKRGQLVEKYDEIGRQITHRRNDEYLITETIDGLGNKISYKYDERGNVISIERDILVTPDTSSNNSYFKPDRNHLTNIGITNNINERALAVGNLTRDNFADVILTGNDRQLNFWQGNSTGQLAPQSPISTTPFLRSDIIRQMEIVDVNKDSLPDIIAMAPVEGGFLEDPILVFINQGNSFSTPTILPLTAISSQFVTGDFNGDGNLDILTRYDSQELAANAPIPYPLILYIGNGNGQFSTQPIVLPEINNEYGSVGGYPTAKTFIYQMEAADFNKDGLTDLVLGTVDRTTAFNPQIKVFFNRGNNGWTKQLSVAVNLPNPQPNYSLVVADLNNDSFLDIINAYADNFNFNFTANNVNVMWGSSSGSFQFETVAIDGLKIGKALAADLDNDGVRELILAGFSPANNSSEKATVRVYKSGASSGLFERDRFFFDNIELPRRTTAGLFTNMAGINTGDIDGDGDLDLVNVVWDRAANGTQSPRILVTYNEYPRAIIQTLTKQYTYESKFNKLTSQTDELGHKTLYDIDTNNGNLLKTTRVVGVLDSFANGETNDVVTSYAYTATGQIDTIIDALGRITDYDYDSYGNAIKTTYAKGAIDETFELFEYDLAGNVAASVDALGRRTQYIYNSMNMVARTIDPLGGVTTYTYDKMGHQTSVTDALGRVTQMSYDSRGRLATVTDANGSVSTNAYDNNGNLLAATDALGRINRYRYDARNRLIGMTAADGGTTQLKYDLNNNFIGSTDALNRSTQKFYDSRDRIIREVDALGNETKYAYDKTDRLITMTDAKGNITNYQYDELGRQIAIVDASGNITRTEYDKLDNMTATVDANGNRTEYRYDALNRRVRVIDALGGITKMAYNKTGNVTSTTDTLNRTTTYAYDVLNRQISVTNVLGNTATNAYDAVGNVILTTDALNRQTSYSYDALNQRIATTDSLGQTATWQYDKVGNNISYTDELGATITHTYDSLNRRTITTDALGNTSKSTYDLAGNLVAVTDGVGNITRYEYDGNDRLVKTTDSRNGITLTTYDAVGNVTKIVDAVGNTTTHTFDALYRLISETNQLGKTRTYSYDNLGNITKIKNRDNREIAYTYDALNRRISETWLNGTNPAINTFNYTYDATDNLLTTTDKNSKYTYTYDILDRVASIDNTGTSGVPAVKFNYSYDVVGNLVTVADNIAGINSGITNYTYDTLNRITRLTQSGNGVVNKRIDMGYNAANRMTSLRRYRDDNLVVETSYVYDSQQRLTNLSHQKNTTTIASYDYSYDAANKLTQLVSSTDGTSNYTYDATNQLTGVDNTAQTDEAYSYDANGNRTNSGYQTGSNNQLLSDGVYNYEYDNEGNRTKRTEIATGKVTQYVWDYRNRLANVIFKDAVGNVVKTVEYLYDVNNQRIGKKIDGAVTERYVLDRNQIALVFDGQGNQTHRYLYGTQVDQVLADETPTSMVWALADSQGTVRDLFDDSGNVVGHFSYDSFGNVINPAGLSFRYGYTGREWDGETGQYYYRARYYDSTVGRFISEDPIGFAAGDTNIYRYVANSPTNWVDPSGHEALGVLQDRLGEAVVAGLGALAATGVAIGSGIFDALGQFVSPPLSDGTIPNNLRGNPPQPTPTPPVKPAPRRLPPPSPSPSPSPSPLQDPFPDIPNPNECEDKKKKTCATEYSSYPHISEATAPHLYFGGFKSQNLPEALSSLKFHRRNYLKFPIRNTDPIQYRSDPTSQMNLANRVKKDPMDILRFRDPEGFAEHYITYLASSERYGSEKSAGSIGRYKFCDDTNGAKPHLVIRYGVLNMKSESENSYGFLNQLPLIRIK